MASSVETVLALKKRLEYLRSARDKALGVQEKHMSTLSVEFGCKDLEQARELLGKLGRKAAKLQNQFDTELEAFMREWGDKLPV